MRKIGWVVMVILVGGCVERRAPLEASARGFALTIGFEPIGVVCLDMDSDGDGYVSCTVRVKGVNQPLAVECASAYSLKSGCRMQKLGGLRE